MVQSSARDDIPRCCQLGAIFADEDDQHFSSLSFAEVLCQGMNRTRRFDPAFSGGVIHRRFAVELATDLPFQQVNKDKRIMFMRSGNISRIQLDRDRRQSVAWNDRECLLCQQMPGDTVPRFICEGDRGYPSGNGYEHKTEQQEFGSHWISLRQGWTAILTQMLAVSRVFIGA